MTPEQRKELHDARAAYEKAANALNEAKIKSDGSLLAADEHLIKELDSASERLKEAAAAASLTTGEE